MKPKRNVKLVEEFRLDGFHLGLYSNDDELFIILSNGGTHLETWEYETEGRAHAEFELAATMLKHALVRRTTVRRTTVRG